MKIWKRALLFHIRHLSDLLPLFPLLCIPLWTDCFHSVLIKQEIENNGKIDPFKGIGKALVLMPSFIAVKFNFYIAAILWSFIPIIGWYEDFIYRIKWAMTSNVIVFEELEGVNAKNRCEKLSEKLIHRKGTNSLVAIPFFLISFVLLFLTFTASTFDGSIIFWISVLAGIWILLPGSAAVNTFTYLSTTNRSNE
jgi:hypothetical protein